MKGLSITLCFGKYAGFHIIASKLTFRICLGVVAFTIYWTTDIEEFINYLRIK